MNSETEASGDIIWDPIDESFPLMVDASRRLCRGKNDPNDLCFKYHRLWPYLRRIGLLPLPSDALHFLESFRESTVSSQSTRILISGCADYSILAHVLQAFRGQGPEPQITVLDICEAPLFINRWYAERQGFEIDTVVEDIQKYSDDSVFDVVTTSNFLNRFDPKARSRLLARWRKLLRIGGKLISSQDIRSGGPTGMHVVSSTEIELRRARILKQAKRNASLIDITPKKLTAYFENYLATRSYYPLRTTEELRMLLENNGFRIDRVLGLATRERRDWATQLSEPEQFDRIRFLATRVR